MKPIRAPSSGMSVSSVVHSSPGATGNVRVRVPVVTISPAASADCAGLARASRRDGAGQRAARLGRSRRPCDRHGLSCGRRSISKHESSRAHFSCRGPPNGGSDEEPPMEAVGRDGVPGPETTSSGRWTARLKAVGDPVDATNKSLLVHARGRAGRPGSNVGRRRELRHHENVAINRFYCHGFGDSMVQQGPSGA